MKQNNIMFAIAGIATTFLAFAPVAYADTCTTQYGGTVTCVPSDLTINKKVFNPITETYVENLTTTDATFIPGNQVTYRLEVKNGSGQTFQATVKDILPPYMEFISGPGTYNKDTRTLQFAMDNLTAGETRTVDLVAKVVEVDAFPAGKSLFCVVNTAEVRALNRFDSDTAQVCLKNGDVVITKLPVAGYTDMMMLLPFAGIGLAGASILLKKRS